MRYGIGRFAVSLLFFSFLGCCHSVPPSAMTGMKLRFLALGDSYTIGEKVDATERWPVQLAARLNAAGYRVEDPLIIARTGWTTDELKGAIDASLPVGRYDLVTLLIGVNNQYRGRGEEEYRQQFKGLLDRAIGFAGGKSGHVVVLSIPDWGVTPFAEGRDRVKIGAEIDRFNAINRELTLAAGAHWVDVTAESKKAASDPSYVAADGLHPSGKMYGEWAGMALSAAEGALGRK